jgi:hypothetical protein
LYSGEFEQYPSLPGCHFAGRHMVGEFVGLPDVGNIVGCLVSAGAEFCSILVGAWDTMAAGFAVGVEVVDKLGLQTSFFGHSLPKNITAQQAS